MICPDCGHRNRPGELLCSKCGADLYDILLEQVSTKKLEHGARQRELNLEESASARPVMLHIKDIASPVAIERRRMILIGRSDESRVVDLDLTHYEGQQKGVSRQHARLNTLVDPPQIIDLNSSNGTFINGERLVAQRPYDLHSGDEIRLGSLSIRLYYK